MSIDLRLGDCLEVMQGMADSSVDLVITDPPYQTTITPLSRRNAVIKGNGSTSRLDDHAWGNCHDWLADVARILRDGGSWYVFMNNEGWSSLLSEAQEHGLKMCRRLVWIKTNSMPAIPKKNYRSSTELAMYGTKGKHTAYFAERTQQELLAHFLHPIVGGHERTKHPTQKPLQVLQKWVLTSCPLDGVVFDPFMGSGTTGVACVNTGRNFIGIEKDATYLAIAQKRIQEAQSAARQMEFAS